MFITSHTFGYESDLCGFNFSAGIDAIPAMSTERRRLAG